VLVASRLLTSSKYYYFYIYVLLLTWLKLCVLRQVWGAVCARPGEAQTVQIIHKGAHLCPVSETKLRGELQITDLVPSVRD